MRSATGLAAEDNVDCGQHIRDRGEAEGATYHWYNNHDLDLTAMRVLDAWWQDVGGKDG